MPVLMLTLTSISEEAGLGEAAPPPAAIIVTVPSSPDEPPRRCPTILRTPPIKALELRTPSDIAPRAPFAQETLSPPPTTSQDASMSPYQERLAAADLPPPGPEYFAARRALWLEPIENPSYPTEPNLSRRRLESLLATPDALENEVVWQTGVDRVWRGLLGGARLKQRLPLALVVRPDIASISSDVLCSPHLTAAQDPPSWMDTRGYMA